MKNTPLLSIVEESFDRMFIVDKRGRMTFFPWGDKKAGYLLKSKRVMARAKKFYTTSFIVCFIVIAIAASIFNSFWGIIGSMLVGFGSWYLVYHVYTSNIVKSLPISTLSYKDIVLEKIEADETEDDFPSNPQFTVHSTGSRYQANNNVFVGIKRIWYRLSPGQLFLVCFFTGIFGAFLWSTYRPEQWIDADYLVGFLVCMLLGYGCFVVVQNIATIKANWYEFLRWKLPMILSMIACWSAAIWCLYKFVVLIIA